MAAISKCGADIFGPKIFRCLLIFLTRISVVRLLESSKTRDKAICIYKTLTPESETFLVVIRGGAEGGAISSSST